MFPSGFLILTASEGVQFVKWAVSSDDQDLSRVQASLGLILSSFKELRGPQHGYAEWFEWITIKMGHLHARA